MKKRNIYIIILTLIIGAVFGGVIGNLFSLVLPESVVKDFFLVEKSVGWGHNENNWADFGFLRFKTGLIIDLSVLSIFGFFISWYFLRYFK